MQAAAIYRRISRDREGTQIGIENQETECRKLAASLGLTVVEVYTDNDISASTRSKRARPGYARMLEDARAGVFKTILAYSNSRLTRRPQELEDLIVLYETKGVVIRTATTGELDLSTAQGRMLARMLGAADAAEAEQTSERVKLRVAGKLAEGQDIGGPRPFGFEKDRWTVRKSEADAIKAAYKDILDGKSIYSIAQAWTRAGFKRDRKPEGVWRTQTVRSILLRERNAGRLVVKGVLYSDKRPHIVDPETFDKVKAILLSKQRAERRGPKGKLWAATGTVRCAVCGSYLGQTGVGRSGQRAMRCSRDSRPEAARGLKHPVMAAEKLEAALRTFVFMALAQRLVTGTELNAPTAVSTIRVELAELIRQREVQQDMATWPGSDLSKIKQRVQELGMAIQDAQRRLEEALAGDIATRALAQAAAEFKPVGSGSTETSIKEWVEYWDRTPASDRRALVTTLLPNAKLHLAGGGYARSRLSWDYWVPEDNTPTAGT